MNLIGYTRVSTSDQAQSGLGLEAQIASLRDEAGRRGYSLARVETDAASGRSRRSRPGLDSALASIEAGEADGLIVAKIDRLSRSVADFARLICDFQANGWQLVICDLALDLSTPMGGFTANILCSVAQLEREMISQRTRDALAAAKRRGVRVGAPVRLSADTADIIRHRRAEGATLAVIAHELSATGTPTATGTGRWSPTAVRRALARPLPQVPQPA